MTFVYERWRMIMKEDEYVEVNLKSGNKLERDRGRNLFIVL